MRRAGVGHGTAGDIAWLGSRPLIMKFQIVNNEQAMVLDTPCNTLNAPVQITDSQIALTDPLRISATAMGCLGPEGEYETWATEFIKTPMTYTDVDGILTLTSSAGAISFTAG